MDKRKRRFEYQILGGYAYAKYLAARMCQKLPEEFTKEAYSEFIDKWKPIVKSEDDAMNEPDFEEDE